MGNEFVEDIATSEASILDDTTLEDDISETSETDEPEPKHPDFSTTMKKVVWICLGNGILWVWCSYILAALDKVQIAESLSQVAVTEIIGVVLVYALKSVIENLSKNNKWPDKPSKDDSGFDFEGGN